MFWHFVPAHMEKYIPKYCRWRFANRYNRPLFGADVAEKIIKRITRSWDFAAGKGRTNNPNLIWIP